MGIHISKREPNLLDSFKASDESALSPVAADHPQCHKNGIYLPSELDPRSPTVGIDRTPIRIVPLTDQSADPVNVSSSEQPISCVEMILDPRSPSDGILRTPIVCYNPLSVDAGLKKIDDLQQLEHSVILTDHMLKFNIDDADEVEQTSADNVSPDGLVNHVLQTAVQVDVPSCNTNETSSRPVDRPTRSPAPRSPLAPYNYSRAHDSPRGIVQRKQVMKVEQLCKVVNSPVASMPTGKKLDKLRGSSSPHSKQVQHQIYCDKENTVS